MSKIDSLIEESFPELFMRPDILYLDHLDRYIMLIDGGPYDGICIRVNNSVGFNGELVQAIYMEEDIFSSSGNIIFSILYNKMDLKSHARLAVDSSVLELPIYALAASGKYINRAINRIRPCGISLDPMGRFHPVAKINSGPWMDINQKIWNCDSDTSKARFIDFVYREITLSGLDGT